MKIGAFTLIALSAIAPIVAIADESPSVETPVAVDQTTIGGDAFRNAGGVTQLNQAAGVGNEQINAATIDPHGRVTIHLEQSTDAIGPGGASVTIDGHVGANATGLISINQVSGVGNAQANLFVIGTEINGSGVGDALLAQTMVTQKTSSSTPASNGKRQITIDSAAFSAAHGILQLNQTAGAGDSTINSMTLKIQPGLSL
jgi:hypothetical protein